MVCGSHDKYTSIWRRVLRFIVIDVSEGPTASMLSVEAIPKQYLLSYGRNVVCFVWFSHRWDVTPCSPAEMQLLLGGNYCLHLHGARLSKHRASILAAVDLCPTVRDHVSEDRSAVLRLCAVSKVPRSAMSSARKRGSEEVLPRRVVTRRVCVDLPTVSVIVLTGVSTCRYTHTMRAPAPIASQDDVASETGNCSRRVLSFAL